MIEIEQVILDPKYTNYSPDQILRSRNLTREQKMDVLCIWEFEARQVGKNNDRVKNNIILNDILKAINKLETNELINY